MKKLIVLFLCLVVLTSCSNQTTEQALQDLKKEIEILNNDFKKLTNEIEEINKERSYYNLENINRDIRKMESNLYMQRHLIRHIPSLEIRLAFVVDELENNELKVQYYEYVEDEEEPLGYRYEDREIDSIKLKSDLWIYVLREFTYPDRILLSNLRKELIEDRNPFMALYFIEGEVILMEEIYLP